MTKNILMWMLVVTLCVSIAHAATLTCQQVSDTEISISEFSSKTIELLCTASGGTVSNIQITPNPDPSQGLTFSSTQTMSSSISDGSTGTAKWSVTGDAANAYEVTYTISSDGTNKWSGLSETDIDVLTPAQLTVTYQLPPSLWTPTVTELDYKISNIGGADATNVKVKLNNNAVIDFGKTISGKSSASGQWTNASGFNQSGTYTTYVYIGDVLHDNVTTTVNVGAQNLSQTEGWNLISLPRIPSSFDPDTVFSDIADSVVRVWGFNRNDGWQKYVPGGSSTLTTMSVDYGYWLKTSSAVGLNFDGDPHTGATINLSSGWNLLGFPSSTDNVTVTTQIASIVSDLDLIWGFNGTTWLKHNPDNYDAGNAYHLHKFQQGYGYWYKMSADANITFT